MAFHSGSPNTSLPTPLTHLRHQRPVLPQARATGLESTATSRQEQAPPMHLGALPGTRVAMSPVHPDSQGTQQDVVEARAHCPEDPSPPSRCLSLCTRGPRCAPGSRDVGAGDAQPAALLGKVVRRAGLAHRQAGRAPQGPPETRGIAVRPFRPRGEPSSWPGDSGGHGNN